ncbi:FitA-like ribbon-helix-helix domain-containing protein [Sporolactobacillus sp. KGMB 08714]|uniref:FitA-like ribbon-helix-helix domain-containing protein n=1 Tax=Sporolactobacillus sp. KGMB 08714 TaxID=3064704 RepID=UPI002FBEE201
MADVKIRGLTDETVKLLDTLAHRRHRSREEFLRELLTRIAYENASEQNRKFYDAVLDRTLKTIEMNTRALSALLQSGAVSHVFVNEDGRVKGERE